MSGWKSAAVLSRWGADKKTETGLSYKEIWYLREDGTETQDVARAKVFDSDTDAHQVAKGSRYSVHGVEISPEGEICPL